MGCTVWLSGLSGAGKTTIAKSVGQFLDKYNIPVYLLDGDELRKGLNSNLGYSETDRAENVRRVAEVAALFAKKGFIVLVSLISPFEAGRASARAIHEREKIRYFLTYVNTPLEVCERNDPKRLYERARAGQVANFTGVSMAYEVPKKYELLVQPEKHSVSECRDLVLEMLADHSMISSSVINSKKANSNIKTIESTKSLPHIEISTRSLEWAQVLAEGWASPLNGFMNEQQYLECLHFKTYTCDGVVHNQSIPIVLPINDHNKQDIANVKNVCLTYKSKVVGFLSDIEIFEHRKVERCARTFGCVDDRHPTIKTIMHDEGDWLVGGKLHLFERVRWNDGLDEYRLTPDEIRHKLDEMKADTVFVFQLRNPLHNGHILLIKETQQKLLASGHKQPVLLLHPIGGWTKDDDVPLAVRIRQHQALMDEGVLDSKTTVLSIFPSPMSYAGPTEVQWHAKGRLVTGIDYYIVGRDPAGVKDPANSDRDLYDPTHGAKVLQMSPGLRHLQILPFKVAAISKSEKRMTFFDPSRADDFEMISGTKMRAMARRNERPPEQFMNTKAWRVLADYYKSLLEEGDNEK